MSKQLTATPTLLSSGSKDSSSNQNEVGVLSDQPALLPLHIPTDFKAASKRPRESNPVNPLKIPRGEMLKWYDEKHVLVEFSTLVWHV